MKNALILCFICCFFSAATFAQTAERWQQQISYEMDIDFNVKKHQYDATQKVVYYNNSPDDLNRIFYHLYFNAFQPNSMMDMKSRTVKDPDFQADKIYKLDKKEQGFIDVKSLTMNGKEVEFEMVGTILEVTLPTPIPAGGKATFEMKYKAQVPVQVRRSGRNSSEGIAYSMTQWYPKVAEYDYQGWHANPYVGREFHGVWGDFDVRITMDKSYIIGGTGYLQNPKEIGHGYAPEAQVTQAKGKTLTWHFKAPNVHDFAWAADTDYTHVSKKAENGPMMHFFYQKDDKTSAWEQLPNVMDKAFAYINRTYGKYPYEQYTFIQGGDGGMEYPMATLITGNRFLNSLVGVSVHELMHSWYQGMMATNESLYPWMDEGFTSYASADVMNYLRKEGYLPGNSVDNPQNYGGYFALASSGMEEPLSTHADHYKTNFAYWRAAYSKGQTFIGQLRYIVGQQTFSRAMLRYYDTWKFKHPNANDFIRIMEKESGLELDWYKEYFVNSTATIDYAVKEVVDTNKIGKSAIILEKIGRMPMPVDVLITYSDDSQELVNIPLRIMRGNKPQEISDYGYRVAEEDWPWTHATYVLPLSAKKEDIKSIQIDPDKRSADIQIENNSWGNSM